MTVPTATTTSPQRAVRWVVPTLLTRDAVEAWLQELPEVLDEVTFHLGANGARSGPGGTESLQAAICLLHRRQVRTKLSFPAATFSDPARAEMLGAGYPGASEGQGTPAEKTLAYRLPGLVLAQLCEPADASSTAAMVRERQVVSVGRNHHLFGHGTARAITVIGVNDHRTHLRANEQDRQRQLESRLLRMLGTATYHPARDTPLMEELLEFVYQATENTFDHGRRSFDGETIQQVRMAAFSRYLVGTGAGAVPLDRHFPDSTPHLRDYVQRVRKRVEAADADPERLRLWSFSVADGGVGIAAKMNNGFDIYERELGQEYKLVQEAVLPEGTTKILGQPGRGRGLVKMMRATHRLGGFFEIRTGRLSLWRSYLDPDGTTQENLDFQNRDSSAFDLWGEHDEHVATAGTVVSVIFPAFDLGQSIRNQRGRG